MLVNSLSMLTEAKKNKYAVVAANFFDVDSARCFVRAAEEEQKPLILAFAQVHHDTGILCLEEAAMIGKFWADKVSTPVALHLDHGTDEAFIDKAMQLGFTSVMLDASMDRFDKNAERTKAVVLAAHRLGISVEAEIGHVGTGSAYNGLGDSDSVYTTADEAVRFAEFTGVDSLAISVGTAHGVYKNNVKPEIQFERLHEINALVKVPLVLHGGSGTGDNNLSRCAHEGISKINVFTDFLKGAYTGIKMSDPADYLALKAAADAGMKETLIHYMRLFA